MAPRLLALMLLQLSEKESSEATLMEHQRQMREALNTKVAEFKQLMGIVERLKQDKQEQQGMHAAHGQMENLQQTSRKMLL